jgi:hypothetical protein
MTTLGHLLLILALTLLVARIRADNAYYTVSADNSAVTAQFFN